ncbi:MAG: NAD(P)/FAD-dependent oxidoreductase [Pseudomonadota bacterium]
MLVHNESITILGAGLTGALLATILAQRGMQVQVIERQQDPRKIDAYAGRSINLAMAARGMNGLAVAGLNDAVAPLLCPMPGRLLHNSDGTQHFQPYSAHEHELNYSVSRAGLNAILLEAAEQAGAEFRFGQRCVDFDPTENRLTLEASDSDTPHRYSLATARLIAADGAGSPVRRAMAPLPGFDFEESLLDHLYQEIAIPPKDGQFAMEAEALHIWPRGGYMFIALPNPERDFTGTLFMKATAADDEPSFQWWQDPERAARWFETTFPDVPALVPDLADQLQNNPTGVMGTVRCNRWHLEDRILLIGDAAHAIVPFHGQGMNAAFEDCAAFSALLDTASDWRDLFQRFSAARVPNANAIADMALENYVEMRDTVRDPKFHLKKALAFELERLAPDQFISRYAMVMFHADIPYATAQERGRVQAQLLDRWTRRHEVISDIDLGKCLREAREALPAL